MRLRALRAAQDAFDAAIAALALSRARDLVGQLAEREGAAPIRARGDPRAGGWLVSRRAPRDRVRRRAFLRMGRAAERRTCEGVLGRAPGLILRSPMELHVAGRTDAGVHATGRSRRSRARPTSTVRRLVKSLGGILPPDITVRGAAPAAPGFDARASAISPQLRVPGARWARSPLRRERVLHHPQPLDLGR